MIGWCTVPRVDGPVPQGPAPTPEQVEARERYLAARRVARLAETEEVALELCSILGLDKPARRYRTAPVGPDYGGNGYGRAGQ